MFIVLKYKILFECLLLNEVSYIFLKQGWIFEIRILFFLNLEIVLDVGKDDVCFMLF